jgi:hypothetical protein
MRDARAREEQRKRGDLADAVGEAQALAASVEHGANRIERARAAIAAARASRDELLSRGSAAAVIARSERYLGRLRRDLEAVLGEQLRADARHRGQIDAVDAARSSLTVSRAEREVIERHFERWRAERRKLAERRED